MSAPDPGPIDLTYLGGPDIDRLALTDDEILDAVEGALIAQGRGQTVIEPRVHLAPDPAVHGHFILFWHRGLSTTDIALGHAMLAKAKTLGLGQRLRYA